VNPEQAAPPQAPDSSVVTVSGNPWLAGSLGLASAAVALGYAGRAQASSEPVLPAVVAVLFSLLTLAWALVTLDARVPRLVMDRHGVRLRFLRTWVGITWADFGEATIRTHRGWWREDLIVPVAADRGSDASEPLARLGRVARWQASWTRRCFGSAYAVPVGWSARVQGAARDLTAVLSQLQSAPAAVNPPPQGSRTQVAGTLRARLRDPRPSIAAGITFGANALQLHPVGRRAILPEADYLQRAAPELVQYADPATDPGADPTHVILVPSEGDAPRPDPAIGLALAKARLGLSLTVPQLAEHTKIPAHVIVAIESGDFATSGGDFHARGQLRTLCRVLGVESAPLIAAYDAELVAPDPAGAEAIVAALGRQREAGAGVQARRWSAGVAVIVAMTLGWSLTQLGHSTAPRIEPPASPSAPLQP